MRLLTELFLTFAQIGAFTFGGGYAMIALIENICVVKKNWLTHDEMMNIAVIAESTPGPIAINCATYVGFRQRGVAGAVAATLGIVLPSFAVIYLIAAYLDAFLQIAWLAHAFAGIKAAVGILILDAGLKMAFKMPKKLLPRSIMLCSAAIMLGANVFARRLSSIVLMLAAAAVSLALFLTRRARERSA